MLNAQFRPLSQWPGQRSTARKASRFRTQYVDTLDKLEAELNHISATNIVIQVEDLNLEKIRNNGWPKASKSYDPNRPGVILSFDSKKGPLSYPCDRYPDWHDNLRAIALSLEALRAVDRYGVTRGNEQYRGWAQIEAPANGKMSKQAAAEFIGKLGGYRPEALLNDSNLAAAAIRRARGAYHPDKATNALDQVKFSETYILIGQAESVLCGEGGK